MKLIYKCQHCGQAREAEMPASPVPYGPEHVWAAMAGDAWALRYVPEFRKWIRHPCEPGVHGMASIVAVIE